jgi:hypothetical protein
VWQSAGAAYSFDAEVTPCFEHATHVAAHSTEMPRPRHVSPLSLLLLPLLSGTAEWTPPSAAAVALQRAVDAAVAARAPALAVAAAEYAFGSASLNVSGASFLALNLSGSALVFSPGAGVSVHDSTDVALLGPVSVGYSSAAFSQATITHVGDACFSTSSPPLQCELDVDLHAGFPSPDSWPFAPDGETKLVFFDASSRFMRRPQIFALLLNATRLNGSSSNAWRLSTLQLWEHSIVAGDVAVVASRDGCAACTVELRNSTRVSTRDLSISGACNMAVLELGGGGAHSHERLVVAPAPGAYLSTNFDGLHSEGALVGPTLLDSRLSHVGDDFLNVQNAINVVLGWRGDDNGSSLVVADNSFGSTFPVVRGASFRFFLPTAGNIWGVQPIWNATVCSSTLLEGADAAPWRPLADNASAAFQARYGWSFTSYMAQGFSIFALAICPDAARPSPPPALSYTALAQVNSSCCAVIRNNVFEDGLARLAPFNSPRGVFEGNIANGTMLGGLLVSAELGWLSGNIASDSIRIADNLFIDCCAYSRVGYPYGACNSTLFPVFDPSGATTNLVLENNTVLPGPAAAVT